MYLKTFHSFCTILELSAAPCLPRTATSACVEQPDVFVVFTSERVVLQDPVVFSGTVRDNLDPFGASAGDSAIWAALRQTGMADTITHLVSTACHH